MAVDGTNMPGVYEFHLPDACLATGATAVHIVLKGAANMVQTAIEIELDAGIDYQAGTLAGNVAGKVLGGGGGTITGVGAQADLQTIKTQAVTAAAAVTVLASVGTAVTSTAQTGDSYAIVNHVTYGLSALKTLVDTITNRIGAFTGTGVNTILGFFKALMKVDGSNPSDLGGTYDAATDSQEAQSAAIAAIDSGSGTGPYTITITVEDEDGDPVPNAYVSLEAVGQTMRHGMTNGSGVVTFNSNGAITWTVAITAGGGLTFSGDTIAVVAASVVRTLEMDTVSVSPPSAPSVSVLSGLVLDGTGAPEPGAVIRFWMFTGPGTAGLVQDNGPFTLTADDDGLIEGEFVIGATYKARRGENGTPVSKTIPNAASFTWGEILGSP